MWSLLEISSEVYAFSIFLTYYFCKWVMVVRRDNVHIWKLENILELKNNVKTIHVVKKSKYKNETILSSSAIPHAIPQLRRINYFEKFWS